MIKDVLLPLVFFAVLGGVLGLMLALFHKKTAVPTDPRIDEVAGRLPGANCGGCGYAGCAALAEAVVKNGEKIEKCVAIKADDVRQICAILGREAPMCSCKMRAVVLCRGTDESAARKYNYSGLKDCVSAAKLYGGSKLCSYGCIGLGSCVAACKFDALRIENGIAVVDPDKCVGCGACAAVCPKGLIELIPADAYCYVACKTQDRGKAVMTACTAGCIGCGLCVRVCESGAIHRENGAPRIDYDKCVGCYKCVEKCPRGIIVKNASAKAPVVVTAPAAPAAPVGTPAKAPSSAPKNAGAESKESL